MAKVNVFIPVYSGSAFIRKSIASVLKQSFRDLELIVVDNCSTDGTVDIIQELAATDPRLILVRNESNIGMIDNFNKCLSLNRGEYYSIICHDDYYCNPKAVEIAVSVLDAHAEVSAIYSQMFYVDQHDIIFNKTAFKRTGISDARAIGMESIYSTRIKFSIPVLVRSSAAKDIRYDNSFTYCADVDFGLQLSRTGYAFFLPDYLIANRFHTSNASRLLLNQNLKQLRAIAEKHSVRLSTADLIPFYVKGYYWMFMKKAFLSIYPLLHNIRPKRKAVE